MTQQVLEGTWDEIARHAGEFSGHRLRLIVLPEETIQEVPVTPNQAMLDTLAKIAKRQENRETTAGEDTQRLLREARAGGMYGFEPSE